MSSNITTIYTSGPLAQNRRVSQQFEAYKAGGAPVAVSDARISMFNTESSVHFRSVLTFVWAFILAMLSGAAHSLDATGSLPVTTEQFDLVSRPGLVISVPKNITESKREALIAAGFAAQTNGRYHFYRGPPTESAMRVAIQQGCVTDAFAPANNVSVNGLIAFSLINRVFYHAFTVIANIDSISSFNFEEATPVDATISFKLTEKNLSELPAKGFYFGYFDGLLLPDKAFTLRVMSSHFANLFGSNAQKVKTLETLHSGWSTLNDTPGGRMLSHMAYCIQSSIEHGIKVRPVYLNSEYVGCVFYAAKAGVIQGNTFISPQPTLKIKEGIEVMQSHDSALKAIAELISNLPLREDTDKTAVVKPESLQYPRDIHNELRKRKTDPKTQQELVTLVKKLKFTQNMWEVTNPRHVMMTIGMITRGEFPDRTVPFNLRIDALWTVSSVYSVLAAYAVRAPSLRGNGTTLTRRIGKEMYSFHKPGRLVGVPIFAKSHTVAKDDWDGVLQELQVWFDHKQGDKAGVLRIKDLTLSIPFDTEEGKTVMNALCSMTKKRGREDEPQGENGPTEEELARQAAAKRRKLKGFGMIGLNFDVPTSGEAMEIEEEVDPFA